MPASDVAADTRAPQLLTVLFWGGVGLAPIAALILLVADGNGPLRLAAVLAIVAVVLIGLSIALRTDEGGRARVQELTDEVEQLRRELRSEIVAAAQRGNQALDQAQRAQDAVAGLHRRLAAEGAGVPAEEPAGPGRARVPVPDDPAAVPGRAVGRPEPAVRQGGAGPAGQAGGHGAVPPAPDRPAAGSVGVPGVDRSAPGRHGASGPGADRFTPAGHGADRPAPGGHGTARAAAGVYGAARPEREPRTEPAPRPLGVVRHTETVHVTTRHTIVDGGVSGEQGGAYGGYDRWSTEQGARPWAGHDGASGDDPERGRRGARSGVDGRAPAPGAGAGGSPHDADRGWSAPRAGGRAASHQESWTPREAQVRAGTGDDRAWSAPADEQTWSARHDRSWSPGADQRGDGPQDWEATAGRPAPAAGPDDTGEYWAQLRAGDRWAAVREDDRGREVRVGERRAEVHADGSGTEYRMADRWAAVRHDEPRRVQEGPGPRRHDDGPAPRRDAEGYEAWQAHDGGEEWRGRWDEPEDRPALPVGGVPVPQEWRVPQQRGRQPEPQWGPAPEPQWGYQPETERYGHPEGSRYGHGEQPRHGHVEGPRYGYPPQDDGPRAGAERWR
ncbi:hypothetical protein GA0070616_2159 [Micromonospora nigra]|uniref:Uncharacterized protein n=1 Tax=Micromonospora nigra TaxID=145857 RepID=A0A1C6RUR4_9ACTN|nr:hypothetical protein [Micromonospora nigra]SCL20971.1 hypothetical protein GA0070616_2159 [Micromonospora nigra]